MIQICATCNHVTDEYVVDKYWCRLVDEPVSFDEKCNSWRKSE